MVVEAVATETKVGQTLSSGDDKSIEVVMYMHVSKKICLVPPLVDVPRHILDLHDAKNPNPRDSSGIVNHAIVLNQL